ncbi:MAG: hypothetical protein FJ272_23375, partial [Planctomycetes bacterium]|nr:hypothetical protein [Planctomycetota bacterium]
MWSAAATPKAASPLWLSVKRQPHVHGNPKRRRRYVRHGGPAHSKGWNMTTFRRMTRDLAPAAFELLNAFLREDEHYLASSAVYGDGGEPALRNALELFLQRPELGFVWLALEGERPVGVCFVCLAISTSTGTLVAKLEDVFVAHGWRSRGVGTQ